MKCLLPHEPDSLGEVHQNCTQEKGAKGSRSPDVSADPATLTPQPLTALQCVKTADVDSLVVPNQNLSA